MENKICSQCGNDMVYKSGISQKNGKPYQMYKCQSCGYVEFLKSAQSAPRPKREEIDWDKIREEKRENISKLNALNNAVLTANAWLQKDRINNREEYETTIKYYLNFYLSLNEADKKDE